MAHSVPSALCHFSICFRTISKPTRVVCNHIRRSRMTWHEICLHREPGSSLHGPVANPQACSCKMDHLPDESRTRSQKGTWVVFPNYSDSNPKSVGKQRKRVPIILLHRKTRLVITIYQYNFYCAISTKCNQVECACVCGPIHNHSIDRT